MSLHLPRRRLVQSGILAPASLHSLLTYKHSSPHPPPPTQSPSAPPPLHNPQTHPLRLPPSLPTYPTPRPTGSQLLKEKTYGLLPHASSSPRRPRPFLHLRIFRCTSDLPLPHSHLLPKHPQRPQTRPRVHGRGPRSQTFRPQTLAAQHAHPRYPPTVPAQQNETAHEDGKGESE